MPTDVCLAEVEMHRKLGHLAKQTLETIADVGEHGCHSAWSSLLRVRYQVTVLIFISNTLAFL